MAEFPSIAHVALTVNDLDLSVPGTQPCSARNRLSTKIPDPSAMSSGWRAKRWWVSINFPIW